ncbi:BBE domain-containing protein [Streptomyces kebangsaanensis]|uniref:BBE domain-containing protein n=1 Tax=Streptomyces kebangsaanensis TaxID=864058 RepID=UPI00094026B9|nr:BBE domain-containing protein [Streptomyces kebangsaanensis]
MADEVYIRLLGGFAVAVGDRPVATGAWRLRKARSPLRPLCPAPGHRMHRMHREKLYGLLRPDLDRTAASNNLHQALHAARRALASAGTPGDVVTLRDDLVLLGHDGGVRIDVGELDDAVRRAAREDIARHGRGAMYVNFTGDAADDKVRASYPGAVLDRLVGVKDAYDPTNLFRLNQNIRPSAAR